ncbi:MAG TPA: hypothetical protein GXX28_11960, partial [Firmicutes bacterium]|nr:hypothetical protein [Bacillota bacterium]
GEPAAGEPEPDEQDAATSGLTSRAEAVLREAAAEAERLLAQARERAAALLEQAKEDGYRAGYRAGEERGLHEGRAKAEEEMAAAVEEAQRFLVAAEQARERIVAASRDDVLKLVRKVAEKITRAALRLDETAVERTVEAALQLVTERSRVLVRVNPEDLERVREGVPRFLRYLVPSTVLEVCADPRVSPGGCLIETDGGNLDAQVETQLEEALGRVEERLHGG